MSMRTPLRQVRGLGSAKSGTEHFWHQRLTAMANIPLTIGFVVVVASLRAAIMPPLARSSVRRSLPC